MKITHKAQININELAPTGEMRWNWTENNEVSQFWCEDETMRADWTLFQFQRDVCVYLGIHPCQVESLRLYTSHSEFTKYTKNDTDILYVRYNSTKPPVYSLLWAWFVYIFFNINKLQKPFEVSRGKAPIQTTDLVDKELTLDEKISTALDDMLQGVSRADVNDIVLDFEHVVNHQFAD